MNEGVSLYVVQALLGHANARTTQRYAHLASDTLNDATEIVDGIVPAQRPMSDPSRMTAGNVRIRVSMGWERSQRSEFRNPVLDADIRPQ